MTTVPDAPGRTRREPTMRDVAALAGVSLKTVSRVVNAEPGVRPERQGRVLDAVRTLDYRHNANASSLRRADRKTATIGLLLENAANPFSAALFRAIEDAARRRDVLVFAGSSEEDDARERAILLALASRRVDGLIMVPVSSGHDRTRHVQRLDRPIVLVDRLAGDLDVDSVTVDNRGGASQAVRHLVAHGHRRIAFLGDLHSIWTASERYLGYVAGIAAGGLPLDPALVRQDLRAPEAAERVTHELLTGPDPPTALFTAQNLITIGVLRALQRASAQGRIALVGFDDVPLADLLDPPVSVVAQDPVELGHRAADLLFARLDGDTAPPRHIVLPTRLIPRGSGELPPYGGVPQG